MMRDWIKKLKSIDLFPDLTDDEKHENQIAAEIELETVRKHTLKEKSKNVYRTMDQCGSGCS